MPIPAATPAPLPKSAAHEYKLNAVVCDDCKFTVATIGEFHGHDCAPPVALVVVRGGTAYVEATNGGPVVLIDFDKLKNGDIEANEELLDEIRSCAFLPVFMRDQLISEVRPYVHVGGDDCRR